MIGGGLLLIYGLLAYALDAVAASAPFFFLLAVPLSVLGIICYLGSRLLQWMTKRHVRRATILFRWSFIALMFAVVGLLGGFFYSPSAVPVHFLPVADELAYMLRTDQSDRFRLLRVFVIRERDQQRLERTKTLYDNGEIVQPQDKLHAALIFQHGSVPADYERAYHLASEAVDCGVPGADWLKNAAYDRG
jgi:hypothetical protein